MNHLAAPNHPGCISHPEAHDKQAVAHLVSWPCPISTTIAITETTTTTTSDGQLPPHQMNEWPPEPLLFIFKYTSVYVYVEVVGSVTVSSRNKIMLLAAGCCCCKLQTWVLGDFQFVEIS
jgi:hypothetical protein